MPATSRDFTAIWQHYQAIKAQQPTKYARDIATEMAISEAELTCARVGHDAVRLQGEMRNILAALEAVGDTKCICRNDYAVHEQIGRFTNLHISERAGLVLNPRALDLRLFISQWASAFHLHEQSPRGERQSIQFFDRQGDAILKVYLTERTDIAEWNGVIARFTAPENPPLTLTEANGEKYAEHADGAALDSEWRAMTDVHQFFGLLKKYSLSRQQAFRLVGDDLACLVSNDALPNLLETVQQQGNEIMIFVGNRGCVQIFTGVLEKLTPLKGWTNIFNENFTLHLRDTEIAESWVTRKPTADGHVTSLELFAKDGTQIAQLYGQRSEGQPEQSHWRAQIDALTNPGKAA
ncbi:hemin-degrading factor [Kosakonia sacchari]|uniref:hemin-degrading factor n=1 Tax=Kosakonia sacchari TaxID=1158459 RepID=UPI001584DEE6|nr:ChuX/HutX family heme-like substrate-binding protein [Kosakonia sacchari]NUL38844.1 hemin-degrading factor [Kosakonia sacchari]